MRREARRIKERLGVSGAGEEREIRGAIERRGRRRETREDGESQEEPMGQEQRNRDKE